MVGHVFTKVTFKSLSTLEKGRQKAPISTRLSKHSIGILQAQRRVRVANEALYSFCEEANAVVVYDFVLQNTEMYYP